MVELGELTEAKRTVRAVDVNPRITTGTALPAAEWAVEWAATSAERAAAAEAVAVAAKAVAEAAAAAEAAVEAVVICASSS